MWRNISRFKACVWEWVFVVILMLRIRPGVTRLVSLRWGPYCVTQLPICALWGPHKFSAYECSLSAWICWGGGCMRVCACIKRCMSPSKCVESRGRCRGSVVLHLVYWDRVSPWTPSELTDLARLATLSQGSACLPLSAGVIGMCPHIRQSCGLWESELRSLHLSRKCFYWPCHLPLTPHINFVFISGLSFFSFKLYLNLLVFLVFVYVWEGGMSEWVGVRATVPKWNSE